MYLFLTAQFPLGSKPIIGKVPSVLETSRFYFSWVELSSQGSSGGILPSVYGDLSIFYLVLSNTFGDNKRLN